MRLFIPAFAMAVLAFSGSCPAGEQQDTSETEQIIRANVSRLSPKLKIDGIRPLAAIPGLYEIRSGNHIFYTDADGSHAIFGSILNTKDHRNLTAARLEDINRVAWDRLPLKDAIVSGDMNGMPVAIFTDPDCPYCRRLEHALLQVKGLKVYTFLYPLVRIHPRSRAKAESIWCAGNRHQAMQNVMLKGMPLKALPGKTCSTPIERNIRLGRRLGITATPTLIARDGRRHAGGMTANQLIRWAKR